MAFLELICLNVANGFTYLFQNLKLQSGEIGSRRPHLCRKLGIGIVPVIDSTGDLIEVISDPAVFSGQLPECGKQLVVDRGNRDNGTDACALNGSADKLRLTDAVGRKAGGKIGIRRCYLFCFYGNATVVGLRRTNGNIANTIESLTAEIFFLSLPLLQSQKRFLATSANKAFAINRPVRFSPLLRSGVGDLAKPDTKNWTRLSPCPICTSNLLIFIQS